jgi:hypothetical protein
MREALSDLERLQAVLDASIEQAGPSASSPTPASRSA